MLYAECTGSVRDFLFGMAGDVFRQSFLTTAAALPVPDAAGKQAAWQRRRTIQRARAGFFQRFPLVLTPTACQPPFPIVHDLHSGNTMAAIIRAYRPLPVVAGLGLPATSVPAGKAGRHSVGVQLISRWFEDERCLAATARFRTRTGTTVDKL